MEGIALSEDGEVFVFAPARVGENIGIHPVVADVLDNYCEGGEGGGEERERETDRQGTKGGRVYLAIARIENLYADVERA